MFEIAATGVMDITPCLPIRESQITRMGTETMGLAFICRFGSRRMCEGALAVCFAPNYCAILHDLLREVSWIAT